ncbi:MAG TPA: HAD family hydrolase [Actinomycetota bacterium]|nr:HAD family hydrolase [Actinomycetota bacterium]
MAPGVVLLDLYETLVSGEWPRWGELVRTRIGVDQATLDAALDVTREARNTGAFGTEEEDWGAVLAAAGVAPDADMVGDLIRIQRGFMTTGVRLYDDALPVVRELRARGARTALVSNCSRDTRPVVERLGLQDEFDAVILSFEVHARKPDAAIYAAALAAIDGAAADGLYVDDQARYCDGARDLGMDTRLIRRPSAAPREGFTPATDGHRVIADLTALLDG